MPKRSNHEIYTPTICAHRPRTNGWSLRIGAILAKQFLAKKRMGSALGESRHGRPRHGARNSLFACEIPCSDETIPGNFANSLLFSLFSVRHRALPNLQGAESRERVRLTVFNNLLSLLGN